MSDDEKPKKGCANNQMSAEYCLLNSFFLCPRMMEASSHPHTPKSFNNHPLHTPRGKTYEERLNAVSTISKPLAGKKLTKKLYKLVKKASGAKAVKRGVKEVVKVREREGDDGEPVAFRPCVRPCLPFSYAACSPSAPPPPDHDDKKQRRA